MDEMKRCPFCGSNAVNHQWRKWAVVCSKCKARGPERVEGADDAIAAWNMSDARQVYVVRFTNRPGGPDNEAIFIELEDGHGRGMAGEWIDDGDTVLLVVPKQDAALVEENGDD